MCMKLNLMLDDEPEWTAGSWKLKEARQAVEYADIESKKNVLNRLRKLPPLVTAAEIVRLREALHDVALGKMFLLHGGDCAELFEYCTDNHIDLKIKLLLQMSLVLTWGADKPILRIARIAGQYAKPRSSLVEHIQCSDNSGEPKVVQSFRGDILNGFNIEERDLKPERLIDAYYNSAATLNYIRAQIRSGIADLHNSMDWSLGHVRDQDLMSKYQDIVERVGDCLRFMHTVNADSSAQLQTIDLYTSHEALVLDYEESLTRSLKNPTPALSDANDGDVAYRPRHSATYGWYDTSAHFLWVGDRTRNLDGAHLEFIRGIENPIGIKIGPTIECEELIGLLNLVNPRREIGKVTLITRYGCDKIDNYLGKHIEAVQRSGHIVVWQCDPMHGNTRTTSSGVKTRNFRDIHSEVSSAFRIHRDHGSILGGIHLELTGDAVTECIGGCEELDEGRLAVNYTSFCDPRLNEKQSLELAFLVANYLHTQKPDTTNATVTLVDSPQDLREAREERVMF